MAPQWFVKLELPFKKMWPDDPLWLPLVLTGKSVEAEFIFGDNNEILDYSVNVLE